MYDQARMMTPFEYLSAGFGTLFESVGAFIGLILLAIALIVVGVALLVGVDHVKTWISKRSFQAGPTAPTTEVDGTAPSKHHMRPYRVAKEKGVPRDDRLNGLILVICGLGLLYIIPAYLLKDKTGSTYQPPSPPPPTYGSPSYSRKFSLSESTPGQAVLGVMTLVVLLATFALLGPEKQTKKATEIVPDNENKL